MKASIGGALLLNIIVIIVGVIIVFFVGILSYSKAYKVKNRIVELIEKHEDYNLSKDDIQLALRESGYSLVKNDKEYCNSNNVQNHIQDDMGLVPTNGRMVEPLSKDDSYIYCVFESNRLEDSNKNQKYYVVVTFVHFDFPVIGDFINIPVYGETKILGKDYSYE